MHYSTSIKFLMRLWSHNIPHEYRKWYRIYKENHQMSEKRQNTDCDYAMEHKKIVGRKLLAYPIPGDLYLVLGYRIHIRLIPNTSLLRISSKSET
ncbi:hypothetical protein WN51_11980 [Melipona quadrifasciata]|uniref:Uncharacterized protein n=1 Tax=Melipona quadrifasciata TaxID=166423 RepID=A0A0M9A4A8_9HYME|nr:hypothetical protein WN51_11980 [Melipona quadrifasciata]